jgi:hypothetical protein
METMKTTTNKIALIFGHKLDDMAHSIAKAEELNLQPVVVSWYGFDEKLSQHEVHIQATPQNQGMDCMNLFLASKELAWKKLKKRSIGVVFNCHTIAKMYDWELTNDEWKLLFDFPSHKRYVDDVILERYEELFKKEEVVDGTEDRGE